MPSADHDHVMGHDNAVPAACCGDGTEGAVLAFGGAWSPVAAVPDEDAGAGLTRLGPEEDRASGQASSLYPANSGSSAVSGGRLSRGNAPRRLLTLRSRPDRAERGGVVKGRRSRGRTRVAGRPLTTPGSNAVASHTACSQPPCGWPTCASGLLPFGSGLWFLGPRGAETHPRKQQKSPKSSRDHRGALQVKWIHGGGPSPTDGAERPTGTPFPEHVLRPKRSRMG